MGILTDAQVLCVLGFQVLTLIFGFIGLYFGVKGRKDHRLKGKETLINFAIFICIVSVTFACIFLLVLFVGI